MAFVCLFLVPVPEPDFEITPIEGVAAETAAAIAIAAGASPTIIADIIMIQGFRIYITARD
jgi:hypothetical protein